ncbi:MAG: Cof-type HAD-IIB family hydrolase [Bacillota bacterium]
MDYKIIFSDMDGTLLKNHFEISDENRTAMKSAIARGVPFVFTTGRSIHGVKRTLESFDFIGTDGYVISYNGGSVHSLKDMKRLYKNAYLSKDAREIIEYAKTFPSISFIFHADERIFSYKKNEHTDHYSEVSHVNIEIVEEPLDESDEFIKSLIIGDSKDLEKVKEKVLTEHSDLFNAFFSNHNYLELVPKDTSKGNGMAFVAELLQIPLEQTIAVGDSENDISMIERAGLGVAVANALDSVKEAADWVLTETNVDHAIAKIINTKVLKNEN